MKIWVTEIKALDANTGETKSIEEAGECKKAF